MSSDQEVTSPQQEDSEDEFDWEEVEVPDHQPQHLEITISKPKNDATANKKKGISHAERLLRIDCHKIHTVALIASARVRNHWLNDPLLHARLLSLAPLHLQTAFGAIHKSRVPDQNQRGRMFERAVENLVTWWANSFFDVIPESHVRNRTFDEVQKRLEIRGLHIKNDDEDEILDVEILEDIVKEDAETIRSAKSLMKHALMRNGSRDTSAQLFTALCRGLGIPARLVVSVQSVPWQASIGKPKPKYERKPKGKGKEISPQEDEAEDTAHWDNLGSGSRLDGEPAAPLSEKAKGKQKATPVVKLRKTKSKGKVLGAPSRLASPDPLTTPPVYWTEVFSRPDARWFPVDPIRALVNKRKSFDPSSASVNPATSTFAYPPLPGYIQPPSTNPRKGPRTKVENRLVYVVAFEEDGYARDVTRRYAREYGAKVAKVQGGSSAPNIGGGGKARQAWWDKVVNSIERPYRLHRDDLEDQELEVAQLTEGMPSTISGFKDHPLYALTRHLKQTETIHPPPPATPELGKFRGESVYPRSAVVSLKTAENWMRNTGRMVKAGEQPMKMVKVRAGTVNRMREIEVLKDELRVAGEGGSNGQDASSTNLGSEIMQGLYAYSQTEPYVPEPVVDGRVPKNNFGNIDLYVPSMLPKGAAHIPFKGVAKIARKLGFDHAEAVTGFEFKKRRAFPIVEGIVIAAENEATILEAFWEAEREENERARIKREDRVLKQWTRLIHGLRIRQRLQEQYATKPNEKRLLSHSAETGQDHDEEAKEGPPHDDDASDSAGGFLAGADKVVQAFHLPKNTHVVLSPPPLHARVLPQIADELEEATTSDAPDFITYDLETMDVDSEPEDIMALPHAATHHVPKTMQELMDEHSARQAAGDENENDLGGEVIVPSPPSAAVAAVWAGEKPTNKITLPSKVSTPNNRSSSRSNGNAPTQARTKPNPRPVSAKRSSAGKATGKKRRRAEDSASDLEASNDDNNDEDEAEEEDREHQPSPNKRTRAKAAPVATPPSTRTLRPRTSKSAAKIAEERQIEEAYKKAVAR